MRCADIENSFSISSPRLAHRPCSTQNASMGQVPRVRGDDHARDQDAVLLAALDDIARLDEDLAITQIADHEPADVAGFDDLDEAPPHRLAQGDRQGATFSAFAVNQIDGEILLRVGAAQAIAILRHGSGRRLRQPDCDGARGQNDGAIRPEQSRCGPRPADRVLVRQSGVHGLFLPDHSTPAAPISSVSLDKRYCRSFLSGNRFS